MKKSPLFFILLALFTVIVLPSYGTEEEMGFLKTSDGISISYDHYRNNSDSCVIICPGYYNSKENRWMRKTVSVFSPAYDVIIFDFRGHGKSGGVFTWSAREYLDVETVIDYAASHGYKHIGIVGYSMGAAAAVTAVAGMDRVESMILISCPSRFSAIDFRFWEGGMFSDLKDSMECNWEGKGARTGNMFLEKKDCIDSIDNIKDVPVLFIHGDNDWIVKARHSKKLYDKCVSPVKKLEIIKGGCHAESLIKYHYEEMKALMLDWFSKTLK